MNVEILLLGVFIGITLLAYMVAINAHGPVRLGLSYLIATAMLFGTVWVIIQYMNAQQTVLKVQEIQHLESEKQQAEHKADIREKELIVNKGKLAIAARLNALITKGTALATLIVNTNLQEGAGDLDGLTARADEMAKKAAVFKTEAETTNSDTVFLQSGTLIRESSQRLAEAAYYYRFYYKADDSDQEHLRERIMRQKAREAGEDLQKAASLIASEE